MHEIDVAAKLYELNLKLEGCQSKLKALIKNREHIEELNEKFGYVEGDLTKELDNMLIKMNVLLSDNNNARLTQSLYRSMKSKCKSPKYEVAIHSLEQGKERAQVKYNSNEDEIDEIKMEISSLENQIANLRNLQNE